MPVISSRTDGVSFDQGDDGPVRTHDERYESTAAKALQDAFWGKLLTIRGQARRARPEGPLQMIDLFGGGYRDRTGDLVIANHALSQLS